MPRKVGIIPKAPLGKILMHAGAKRISAKALTAFADVLVLVAEDISKRAWDIAKHSGRKTIQEEDIKLAMK